MGKLFGTDGIRGVANQYPMTPEMGLKIGRAVVGYFRTQNETDAPVRIIIGKDTRVSGDMLEAALVAGICAAGGDPVLAGIIPTPGVAYLVGVSGAKAGIVISASHNPYADNGIKLFGGDGSKLSDDTEAEIEAAILTDDNFQQSSESYVQPGRLIHQPGRLIHQEDAGEQFRRFLKSTLPPGFSLEGMKIVVDGSNGATFEMAPTLFAELGADVIPIFVSPDGVNINYECGSQHPEVLIETVRQHGARVGLAFDGDGDRLIAVDELGNVVTGDQILAICAKVLKDSGRLANNTVVSTVMSNLGFRLALKEMDIRLVTADVGDRYVLAGMQAHGAIIGGEDSGHMIFLAHHTTGDGLLTALKLLEAMQIEAKPLSQMTGIMQVFPQNLMNVEVREKPPIENVAEIGAAIRKVEDQLGEQGRVLVRYSGTQPLCRVMVEGPTREETDECCRFIVGAVQDSIGMR